MTARGFVAFVVGGVLLGAVGSASAATPRTIETSGGAVSRIGSFRPAQNPTVAAAIRAFGRPSVRKVMPYQSCLVEWRPLRLRIYFANYGSIGPGQTVCSGTVGRAQSFVVRSQRFQTWRGLRVLDPSQTIRALHPTAEFRSGSWWLRTAVSPYGEQNEYGVVRALVDGGAVRAFTGWIGAAGD